MVRTRSCLSVLLLLMLIGFALAPMPVAGAAGSAASKTSDSAPPPASAESAADFASGWRTVEKDGVHWLVAPAGQLFYSKGVNFLDAGKDNPKSKAKQAFYWGNFFSTIEEWRRAAGAQLQGWGFNTRGGWSDPSPEFDLALTVDLELGRNSKFHWFDPFSPEQERETLAWAEKLTAPYRNDPKLLGYFSDNEVGWWNSALFIWYLSKGWENHTKRFLWQLVFDHYQGHWDRLLQDWVPELSIGSFEDLKRAGAKLQLRPGGYGIQVVNRFMHRYCQHYYRLMARALRQAHPRALLLGDRLPLYYHQDALLAMNDSVDVISTNYNVDVPDGWVAPYYFEGLRRLSNKPVLVTEFFFAAQENRSGNNNQTARSKYPKPGHLMTVATQAERAFGVKNALRHFARFPNVVGTHWFQYCDEPLGGREDGEDYNMGLIDLANRPYEEVTEVFSQWNPKLDEIHREGTKPPGQRPTPLTSQHPTLHGSPHSSLLTPHSNNPMAPYRVQAMTGQINVTDQSLMDWDKERTRLLDLQTPSPYVPFGDVHLAWAPEGLYLATLANTYVDPGFLAYQGEFPLSETFQIHLQVNPSSKRGKTKHYAIHLVPQPNPAFPDGFEVKPQLWRYANGRPAEQLATESSVQRIEKSLPHMVVEAFFPAAFFGEKRLRAGQELQMNIHAVSYYRELIMSWKGSPQLLPTKLPEGMKRIVLQGRSN